MKLTVLAKASISIKYEERMYEVIRCCDFHPVDD